MAFTNSTPNYGLPQWIAADKPKFLTDINNAYATIDTQLKNANDTANTADGNATSALSIAGQAASTAESAATVAGQAAALAQSVNELVGTLNAKMGTTSIATIGDGTVTGAIDALNSDLFSELYTHTCNSTDTYKSILNAIYPIVSALDDDHFRRTLIIIGELMLNPTNRYNYVITYFNSVTEISIKRAVVRSDNSIYGVLNINTTPAITNVDYTDTAIGDGIVVKLVYA